MEESPKKQQSTPGSETRRTSERRKNQKEFTMPSRADVWDKIADVPTTGIQALRPRKLVNDFVHVQSRYNYDEAYTSGEESPFAVSDDDSDAHVKCKSRQQKFAKKRNTESSAKKSRSKSLVNRQQQKSSESLESSDDSTTKMKKQNKVKGTLKKLHMKVSSHKLFVDSPLSSGSGNEAALSCPKRVVTVVESSDSDVDPNSEKQVKMFNITKKKKNVSALNSSSNSDNEQKSNRPNKSLSFGEKDKKPKRGGAGKKTKSIPHTKRDSSDDNAKGSSLSVSSNSQNIKRSKGKKSSISSEHSGSVTDDKAHESLAFSESEVDTSPNNPKKKNRTNIIDSDGSGNDVGNNDPPSLTGSVIAKEN